MKEPEVEAIVQRLEFIAKDFKQSIRLAGIAHVRTSPYFPQSNDKLERWHGTLKSEEFRDKAVRNVEEARRVVDNFVTLSKEGRFHSSLGYTTPKDTLAGRDTKIFASRDAKIEAARAKCLGAKPRAAVRSLASAALG